MTTDNKDGIVGGWPAKKHLDEFEEKLTSWPAGYLPKTARLKDLSHPRSIFSRKELVSIRFMLSALKAVSEKGRITLEGLPAESIRSKITTYLKNLHKGDIGRGVGFQGRGLDEDSQEYILEVVVDGHSGDMYLSKEMWLAIYDKAWGRNDG